jgi:hypothetical protein
MLQFLHHYRINQKQTPQLGRLLARIFTPVLLAPDDIDVDFQTDVSIRRRSACHVFAGNEASTCVLKALHGTVHLRVHEEHFSQRMDHMQCCMRDMIRRFRDVLA